MGLIEKLLQKDKEQLTNRPTAEVEIERFSELIGEPCIFKVQALGTRQMREIRDFHTKTEYQTVNKNGKKVNEKVETVDDYAMGLDLIVESTVEPDFRDSRLREKFKTEVPSNIVEEMLLPGEIKKLMDAISEISGIEGNADSQKEIDKEIKNS